MIESNVDERLTDRRTVGRIGNLPVDRARLGVQRLATVATLSAKTSFPVRDSATTADAQLQPEAILSEWRRDEVKDLLQLPIFDEGTASTIRVHVKEVQEFLCAQWLRDRVQNDLLTQERLAALLFRPSGARTTIPTHLASVAAWLALDNSYVSELMIEHAPHQLLDEGDPASLPTTTRERILRAYAAKFGDRNRTEVHFNERGLRRFSHPDLSPVITELISSVPGEDVRATMLDIVAAGKLGGCADIALQLAMSSETPGHVRDAAVRAASHAGSPTQRVALAALASAPGTLDLEVAGTLVASLYPDPLTTGMLSDLIEAIASRADAHQATRLHRALSREVVQRCPPNERLSLASSMNRAVEQGCEWISESLVELVAVHLRERPKDVFTPEIDEVLGRFDTLENRWESHDSNIKPLEGAAEHVDLRRNLLKWYVQRLLGQKEDVSIGCSSQIDAHARRLFFAGFGDLGVMSTMLAST